MTEEMQMKKKKSKVVHVHKSASNVLGFFLCVEFTYFPRRLWIPRTIRNEEHWREWNAVVMDEEKL